MEESIISLRDVTKKYKVYEKPSDKLKEILFFNKKMYHRDVEALSHISFEIKKGERVGLLGHNGSGKSTLLKIISNVLAPTHGQILVNGRVSALLELGTGFNQEFTGRENIYQYGIVNGLSKRFVDEKIDDIISFSELGMYIDQPIKTYSSGMGLRLAFSCATFIEPEILIIDEALSVGDSYFQNKCLYKIRTLLDKGTTFLYVSHSPDSVRNLCTRGILLENGKIIGDGEAGKISRQYEKIMFEKTCSSIWSQNSSKREVIQVSSKDIEKKSNEKQDLFTKRVETMRTGDGDGRVEYVELFDSLGNITDSIKVDETVTLRIHYKINKKLPINSAICVGICDKMGNPIYHFNPLDKNIDLSKCEIGKSGYIDFIFTNSLCPGEYNIILGFSSMIRDTKHCTFWNVERLFDYCIGGFRFSVNYDNIDASLWGNVVVPYSVKIEGEL